ncbi:MAG: ABC transporter ATP-binding protein [Planctomycetota bacterium]
MHAMDNLLSVRQLSKQFETGSAAVLALSDVSLEVRSGEFVVIMGASGSGKSTLLHLIGGLDRPTSGSILIEDRDLAHMSDRGRTIFRRQRLGIIFQSYNLLPTLSATENVLLPSQLDGRDGKAAEQRARKLLDSVDLKARANHRPQAMSGGEQQRVAIARALMNDPALILADEPTGNLDTQHGETVWKLLHKLTHEEHRTVIAVTHEAGGASFADRIIVLKNGRIMGEIAPRGVQDAAYVATSYTQLVG